MKVTPMELPQLNNPGSQSPDLHQWHNVNGGKTITQIFWNQLSKENLRLVNIKDWPYLMGYIAEALI